MRVKKPFSAAVFTFVYGFIASYPHKKRPSRVFSVCPSERSSLKIKREWCCLSGGRVANETRSAPPPGIYSPEPKVPEHSRRGGGERQRKKIDIDCTCYISVRRLWRKSWRRVHEKGGGEGKNRYRFDLLHKRTAAQGLTESTTIHNRELTLSMFFCGPFGCSLTPSTRRSGFGLETYSDPRLFDAIKLRPERSLILLFWFLWYAQAMSPITKKWPSFKHASAYFKKKLFELIASSSFIEGWFRQVYKNRLKTLGLKNHTTLIKWLSIRKYCRMVWSSV